MSGECVKFEERVTTIDLQPVVNVRSHEPNAFISDEPDLLAKVIFEEKIKPLKPSEIENNSLVNVHRETGRITDAHDLDIHFKPNKSVCCCINPYIDEEPSIITPENDRDGDIYKHHTVIKNEIICFNLCFMYETESKLIFQRAKDGKIVENFDEQALYNLKKYYLVKSERCEHRHHDLRRFSSAGRILTHLFTADGLLSTLQKILCIASCVDEVSVETIRCERSLYRRHW